MRVSVASNLVQRTWQDSNGNKRQTVEIEFGHVGPDLQFATAEVSEASSQEDAQEPAVPKPSPA
jgi:single-stranded DNA-binding protein